VELEPFVMVMVIMRMRVMRKKHVMYMKMGTMLRTMQLMIMLGLKVGLRIRNNLKL
jgi:hypothetical protein